MREGVEHLTMSQIAALLLEDGYSPRWAPQVKFAAFYGALEWTPERLRTTREINLDLIPDKRKH
jgi:hypothetical protein